MHKSKKRSLCLLSLLCLVMLFGTACGSNNMTSTQAPEASTAAENEKQQLDSGMRTNENYGSYYVYTPSSDRSGLIRDTVDYSKDFAEDLGGKVRETLSELFTRNSSDYIPLAADEKNIKSISLDQDGTLLIDFDKTFAESINEMEMPDNAAVYGLVNTLAQYSTIKSVLFTVEGKPITVNNITYSAPFKEDPNMIIE